MQSTPMKRKGFTLVEVLVGTAVFLTVATAAYSAYVSLIQIANQSQAQILAVELADEQFEIVRNMPYTSVGLTDGIPLGVLPQTQTLARGGFTFTVTLVVRNVDLASSTLQASAKLVEVDIACASCKSFNPIILTGQVSPANLQSAAAGGALVVQVANSGGNVIQGATVVIQSTATSSVTDTDVTNDDGVLEVIGVPPGTAVYQVSATKSGYSSDQVSPNANVLQGQVTQVNLTIDKLSNLNVASVGPTCSAVPSMHFHMTGTKMSGGVPKYSHDLVTGGTGNLTLTGLDADTYTIKPIDSTYEINGTTPFSPFKLLAGSTQTEQLVSVTKGSPANSLAVAVADNGTKLPLSGATVELYNGGTYDQTYITGQGYFDQTDWSGGSGAPNWGSGTANKYASDNGGVDTATASSTGSIQIHWDSINPYNKNATGTLESSTFDTGTTSNFYSLNWSPSSQPIRAGSLPVKFQFATAPSTTPNGPWSYFGPDGTVNTYYTTSGMQISSANNSAEYARYLAYLTTNTATVTPSVGDVSFTYTSGCTPPGQVLFQSLATGSYTVKITKTGYVTQTIPLTVSAGWQSQNVSL